MTQPGDTPEAPTGAPPASADPPTEDIDNELAQMAAQIAAAPGDPEDEWGDARDLFVGLHELYETACAAGTHPAMVAHFALWMQGAASGSRIGPLRRALAPGRAQRAVPSRPARAPRSALGRHSSSDPPPRRNRAHRSGPGDVRRFDPAAVHATAAKGLTGPIGALRVSWPSRVGTRPLMRHGRARHSSPLRSAG